MNVHSNDDINERDILILQKTRNIEQIFGNFSFVCLDVNS